MCKIKMFLASSALVSVFNSKCPTVTVKHENGKPVRINASDYDPDKHGKIIKDEVEAVAGTDGGASVVPAPGVIVPPAPAAPEQENAAVPTSVAPDEILVAKDKTKFYAVRPDGSKITDIDDLDAKGYASDSDAWNAIFAYKAKLANTPPIPTPPPAAS